MPRATVLVVALLAACSSARADTTLNPPTIDTLPGGIVRVTNKGPTAWLDTNGVKLVLERTIEPAEGTAGEIGKPGSLTADAEGNVYLMQTSPTVIKVYGPDGTWRRDIGRDGDGPGEFRSGMFGIYRDTLFVQDPNNTRLTIFRTSGEFVSSAKSQCCWWTSDFPVFADGSIGIMGPGVGEGSRGALFVTHLNGVVSDTMPIPIRDPTDDDAWRVTLKQGTSTSMMAMPIPLRPQPWTAWLANKSQVGGEGSRYEFAITRLTGDTVRTFTAPFTPVSITTAQRDSIYEDVVSNVVAQWRDALRAVAKKDQIPTTWPPWTRPKVDGQQRIWIGRPGAKGDVTTLDVFTSDGILLGSVPAPTTKILDGYWTADHVYLVDSNDEGLPVIRVYRITEVAS